MSGEKEPHIGRPSGGAWKSPEWQAQQDQSQFRMEPFYRAKRRVGFMEIMQELAPLARRLPSMLDMGEGPFPPYREIFTRDEYLKFRRLRRRMIDALALGVSLYYSRDHGSWVVDEQVVGGGITPLPRMYDDDV